VKPWRPWWSNKLQGRLKVAPSRPRLRRSPQGNAPGHRGVDRRQGHLWRARHQSSRGRSLPWPAPPSASSFDKENTTIVDGGGGQERGLRKRIAQIKKQIEDTTSDYDKEKLQNAWRNWPAAWPLDQGRRLHRKPEMKAKKYKMKTPCTRPARCGRRHCGGARGGFCARPTSYRP